MQLYQSQLLTHSTVETKDFADIVTTQYTSTLWEMLWIHKYEK